MVVEFLKSATELGFSPLEITIFLVAIFFYMWRYRPFEQEVRGALADFAKSLATVNQEVNMFKDHFNEHTTIETQRYERINSDTKIFMNNVNNLLIEQAITRAKLDSSKYRKVIHKYEERVRKIFDRCKEINEEWLKEKIMPMKQMKATDQEIKAEIDNLVNYCTKNIASYRIEFNNFLTQEAPPQALISVINKLDTHFDAIIYRDIADVAEIHTIRSMNGSTMEFVNNRCDMHVNQICSDYRDEFIERINVINNKLELKDVS